MVLFSSRFAGFVFLSTFDELRVYKAELEHMQWLLKMICHLLGEEKQELCFKIVNMITERK